VQGNHRVCDGVTGESGAGNQGDCTEENRHDYTHVQTWRSAHVTSASDGNVAEAEIATQLAAWHESKKPRPRLLTGSTYRIETPLGKAFITVNENGGKQPFEVFLNTAKAGSETAAVSEAIGRLISYILRLASPIAPRERMDEVVRQLSGIGGGRSLGFGPNAYEACRME